MSPIYAESGRAGLEKTIAEMRSVEVFNRIKQADQLRENVYGIVNQMLQTVREVSPDCGEHSGRKNEEYWYRVSDLGFVIAVVTNDTGSVKRTDYLPVVTRIRSGNSMAVATGVITADGLFYPIRPSKDGDKMDVVAFDKSGLKHPIEYGLEEDPGVVENEDVLYMGKTGKCEVGNISFSFIDPRYADFSGDTGNLERAQVQKQIMSSLERQTMSTANL